MTIQLLSTYTQKLLRQFIEDDQGDEIFEKAAVIAAVSVAVAVLIALGAAAANALSKAQGWFG